ncbi:hypothetical protein CLAFUW4_00814 [Fulvia fulva]|uniref:Uncharacterized protein n=1 Tax=Passalora fulva TaxID=5499 RepID=A0A9Q8P3N6_PASFU|nr:uncharacterized protein CLAFUR5_00817 [Fulvia fulva]KAK4635363.1 hypothetical protein CLAFUR4_00815 [Fulvia fulva]KAK4638174.1 hypothetical protein CLAFUR0_00816 [Fulvia fulva]UJO12118.1 hypothetical protein CLAFUR5_00817 [Fulvia fulva]WPV09092.1 hypothetical protein CLAFUW4_00814 [Fulvia fulva]WPV24165.1 hypothetical protein CLAFUW7_01002 [Fulvia fulva]
MANEQNFRQVFPPSRGNRSLSCNVGSFRSRNSMTSISGPAKLDTIIDEDLMCKKALYYRNNSVRRSVSHHVQASGGVCMDEDLMYKSCTYQQRHRARTTTGNNMTSDKRSFEEYLAIERMYAEYRACAAGNPFYGDDDFVHTAASSHLKHHLPMGSNVRRVSRACAADESSLDAALSYSEHDLPGFCKVDQPCRSDSVDECLPRPVEAVQSYPQHDPPMSVEVKPLARSASVRDRLARPVKALQSYVGGLQRNNTHLGNCSRRVSSVTEASQLSFAWTGEKRLECGTLAVRRAKI